MPVRGDACPRGSCSDRRPRERERLNCPLLCFGRYQDSDESARGQVLLRRLTKSPEVHVGRQAGASPPSRGLGRGEAVSEAQESHSTSHHLRSSRRKGAMGWCGAVQRKEAHAEMKLTYTDA